MATANLFMSKSTKISINEHDRRHNCTEKKDDDYTSVQTEDTSTLELLNKKSVFFPTERLISESIPNLLGEIEGSSDPEYQGFIKNTEEDTISDELAHFNNIKLSENDQLLNSYNNVATPQNQFKKDLVNGNLPFVPLTKDISDEELLEILPRLYNRIQVFLLRNQLSLNFLKRFKSYIGYLIELGFNPLTDEYLLRVQDCLSEGFSLTYEMEFIIKKFLFKPDNLILKLVNYQFNKSSNLLQMHFSLWKIKFVTQSSLTLYETFIKAKFLHKWTSSFNKYGMEYKEQSNNVNKTRLKEFGFDKLLIAYDTLQQMTLVADSKFKQTIFMRFKKIYSLLIEDEKIFTQRRDDLLRKHYLKIWMFRFRLNEFVMRRIYLKKKFLSKIRTKYEDREAMTKEAATARYLFLTKKTVLTWKNQLKRKNKKHEKLILSYKISLKRRYFNRFLSSYKLSQSISIARDHLDKALTSHILCEMWYKRLQERLHFYSFTTIQNEAIKKKYIHLITKQFYLQIKAYQFRGESLLKSGWKSWKKRYYLQKKLMQFKGINSRQKYLKYWNKQTKLIFRYQNSVISKIYSKYFTIWRIHNKKISCLNKKELGVYRNNLGGKFIQKIRSRTTIISSLDKKCAILVKSKVFGKIKRKYRKIRELKLMGKLEWPQIYSAIIMNTYLQKWISLYNLLKEKRLRNNLSLYTDHKRSMLLNKYFQMYYRRSIMLCRNLIIIADDMNNRRLLKHFSNLMLLKFNNHQSEYLRADILKENTIIYDIFTLWKYRLDELNNLLQQAINEKNLYLLSTYLRLWSMNHFKIARNERTVHLFRQRWERATVRGLITLWKMKTENRRDRIGNQFTNLGYSNIDDEGHFSDNSNISPRHIVEMRTPKKQVSNTTIPGSLQMRRYKMQEMISHYNKARIIPSPLKESSTLPNTVKKRLQSKVMSRQTEIPNDPGNHTKSPGKLRFSDLTSLRPPPQSHRLKHRSQSVLNGSPERRIPILQLSKPGFSPT